MRRILLALLLSTGPAIGQQPALTRHIEFYNPRWSPDGRSIAFESTLDGKHGVYTIRSDGSALKALAVDAFNNEQPAWSPDGRSIVFSSDRAGHSDLYLMRTDGSSPSRLTTTSGGGVYGASFSPDGKRIVFQGRPDNALVADRVYVVNVDGTGFRQLTDSTYGAESPRWAANGRRVTFERVKYPRLRWSEMRPADVAEANRTRRAMSVAVDGSDLRVETTPRVRAPKPVLDATGADDPKASPDGGSYVYERTVDGWSGLWRYDVATRSAHLVIGGPGAGPVGYIRTAKLSESSDTVSSYTSVAGSPVNGAPGKAFVIQSVRRAGATRWDVISDWSDTSGTSMTTRQMSRTRRGSFAIEMELVRAPTDSASMLATADRVTGWVVPAGQSPRLFDGPSSEERYSPLIVYAAIAQAKPADGQVFLAPSHGLYSSDPIAVRTDTLRVLRRDTLTRAGAPVTAIVVQRGAQRVWIDEVTGRELASRGNAGPSRWWWHVVRGVEPPRRPD